MLSFITILSIPETNDEQQRLVRERDGANEVKFVGNEKFEGGREATTNGFKEEEKKHTENRKTVRKYNKRRKNTHFI